MSFSVPEDLSGLSCWPLGGYAPGGYFHPHCRNCNKAFNGDKRAVQCLECAIKSLVNTNSELVKAASETRVIPETIVAAAVFHGCTISLPPPARHHTILNFMATVMNIEVIDVHPVNQGFLTSQGRFVNRTEAFYIADRNRQIRHKSGNQDKPVLYSEDLW